MKVWKTMYRLPWILVFSFLNKYFLPKLFICLRIIYQKLIEGEEREDNRTVKTQGGKGLRI